MYKKNSLDPRSVRARQLIYDAFLALLREKSFQKISVKDIVERAGLARTTFYSHFETKDDFFNSVIDRILDPFFSSFEEWNRMSVDPDNEKIIGINFFAIWRENAELLNLLGGMDLDYLLISRLKSHFRNYYDEQAMEISTGIHPTLANYFISFNAYAFVSFLRQWIQDDMKYPSEMMGQLLFHFTNPALKNEAFEKFKDLVK